MNYNKDNKDFVLFTLSLQIKNNKERKLSFCIKHLYLSLHILLFATSSLAMFRIHWGCLDFIWSLRQIRMNLVADALINFGIQLGNPVFNYILNSFIIVPMIVILTISTYNIGIILFAFIRKISFTYFSLIIYFLILLLKIRGFLITSSHTLDVFWIYASIYTGVSLARIVIAYIVSNLIIKRLP